MRSERHLFEIAIYRLPEEDWSRDLDRRLQYHRQALLRPKVEKGLPFDDADSVWADSVSRQPRRPTAGTTTRSPPGFVSSGTDWVP